MNVCAHARECMHVCKAYLCRGTAASTGGQCHCICLLQTFQSLHNSTFKLPDWYLNCSTQFMKNVLLEQETIKLSNKCNFVKKKKHIHAACLKNVVYFLFV